MCYTAHRNMARSIRIHPAVSVLLILAMAVAQPPHTAPSPCANDGSTSSPSVMGMGVNSGMMFMQQALDTMKKAGSMMREGMQTITG